MIWVDLLLAARLDDQFRHSDGHVVRPRSKVLSTKVSVDLHNRFNLLAEYLFEGGLSESFSYHLIKTTTRYYLFHATFEVIFQLLLREMSDKLIQWQRLD